MGKLKKLNVTFLIGLVLIALLAIAPLVSAEENKEQNKATDVLDKMTDVAEDAISEKDNEKDTTAEKDTSVSDYTELIGYGPCEAHEITVGDQWGALGFFNGEGKTYKFVKGTEQVAVIQVEDASNTVLAGPKEVKAGDCFTFDEKQYLVIKKLEYYKGEDGKKYLSARYRFTCDCAGVSYPLPTVNKTTEEEQAVSETIKTTEIAENVSAEEELAKKDIKIEKELAEQVTETTASSTVLQNNPNFLHRLWDKILIMQKRLNWQAQKISRLEIENAQLSRRIARLEAMLLPTVTAGEEKPTVQAAAGKLVVKVIDAEGNPVEGARVIATPMGALTGATEKVFAAEKTDASGKAVLKLRPGRHLVRAEAMVGDDYYYSERHTVKILPDQLTELEIKLKAVESETEESKTEEKVTSVSATGEAVIDGITVKGPLQVKNKKLYVVKKQNGKVIAQQVKNPKEALVDKLKEKLTPEQIEKLKNIRAEVAENKMKVTYERPNNVPIWNWIQPTFTETTEVPLDTVTGQEEAGIIITGNKPAEKVGIIITGDKPTEKAGIIIQNGKTLLTKHLMKSRNWSQPEAEKFIQTIKNVNLKLIANKIMLEIQYANGETVTEEVASEAVKEVNSGTGNMDTVTASGKAGIIIQNGQPTEAGIIIQNGKPVEGAEEIGIIVQN